MPGKIPPFDPTVYGARFDGHTDDTAAFLETILEAAAVGGVIDLPPGVCVVSGTLLVTLAAGLGVLVRGQHVDSTTIQVAPGSFAKNGLLFNLTGPGTFAFDNLTIDLNGQNQNWGASGSNDFYKAISGDGNGAGTTAATLLIGRIKVKNASMSAADPQGIAVNTFGLSTWDIGTLLTEACDYSLFITQAFANTPNRGSFRTIMAHNHNNAIVLDEGGFGGPGWNGGSVMGYLDALCGASVPADGLRVGQGAASSGINLDKLTLVNGRYPINCGNGLSDSNIGRAIAKGCRGSFNIQSADGTCSFSQLVADGCAIGGMTGGPVFASFEVGNVAGDAATIGHLVCNNSQNQAIQGFGGGINILGGRIKNGTTTVALNTPTDSAIRAVYGFNPVGDKGSPAVPASGTPMTNPFGVDCLVFVTAAAGAACTVTLQGVNVQTIPAAGGPVMYVVPARGTIQYNYTSAPTHHWVGT